MHKRAPNLEWQIAESDADWERLQALSPDRAPDTNRRLRLKHYRWSGAALLLLLVGVGEWWRTAPPGLPQLPAELRTTAQQEVGEEPHSNDTLLLSLGGGQTAPNWECRYMEEHISLHGANPTDDCNVYLGRSIRTVEIQDEQGVTRAVMYTEQGTPAYRQTRFYQRITTGWLRTAPDAALWGAERSLETPFFVYHFRQNDAPAVIAVLAQMDTLYNTMRRNVGLPITLDTEKLVIEVSVTQSPGNAGYQPHNYERFVMADRLVVASPALYLAPVELTDASLLAQSIALPLLEHVLAQASERYTIGGHWQPLLDGLRLWHLWEMDLPLAGWRTEIIRWIYLDLPSTSPDQPLVLPQQYEQICTSHTLWMQVPVGVGIPLLCSELDGQAWYLGTWGRRHPPIRLRQIALPTPDSYPYEGTPIWGQTVALATLIEYAVASYGRERLPALVAGLGQYESWGTLIPAVFGVSAAEFEAGWQAHLAAHYGVSPAAFQP